MHEFLEKPIKMCSFTPSPFWIYRAKSGTYQNGRINNETLLIYGNEHARFSCLDEMEFENFLKDINPFRKIFDFSKKCKNAHAHD
jgi:hypothetical protein